MNFDQLANLIKAGFNEEQIRNIGSIMDTGTNTGTNTGTGTNTSTPAPTTTALPTPTVTPAPTSTPATGGTLASAAPSTTPPAEFGGTDKNGGTLTSAAQSGESETVTLLKEMLGIIQKGNINAVGTGAAAQETGVDVLAEILNPTPKK